MARVALVTGGTRGIGKAIVQRLKEDGMLVAAGYSGNQFGCREGRHQRIDDVTLHFRDHYAAR